VRLRVGGDTQTQTFALRKDPRSPSSLADLQEQFRFLIAVRDKVTEANNAVRTVRNVRFQVEDRRKKIGDNAEFASTAKTLLDRLAAAEGEIYQVRNQSSQDPLNYPIKLNNKIAALSGVAGGEYRPTRQVREVFTTLSKDLDTELAKIKAALDELLPKLNATLRGANLEIIVPSTAELKEPKAQVAT
jgi:molybdopterin converting factor small subunit